MRTKTKLLLIALIAVFVTLLTQPSLAYYSIRSTITNVVTSGSVEMKIHEKTADGSDFPVEGITVLPGDIVSKQVSVENVCTHPFYLRVTLSSAASSNDLDPNEIMRLDINTEYWTLKDGFYYYNRPLQPGAFTEPLFTQVEILGNKVTTSHIGATLSITVNAYAVQSENNTAANPWDASGWPKE